MSSIGELFITEKLTDLAIKHKLINSDYERLDVSEEYYFDINKVKQLPKVGSIPIEGNQNDTLNFVIKILDKDEYKILEISRGTKKISLSTKQVDYIEYLKPILEDLKDGEDSLSEEDIDDYLIPILTAKIKLYEGIINQEQHDIIMNYQLK